MLLAGLVALATVIADFFARLLISATRTITRIINILAQQITSDAKIKNISKEIEKFRSIKLTNIVWGSELAAIAFSMDLAILSIWVSNQELFKFFERFDSEGVSRGLPIWTIILVGHFILFLISIYCKYLYNDIIETVSISQRAKFFKNGWVTQNFSKWLSNGIGLLSLITSFVIITNPM